MLIWVMSSFIFLKMSTWALVIKVLLQRVDGAFKNGSENINRVSEDFKDGCPEGNSDGLEGT